MRFDPANVLVHLVSTVVLFAACAALPAAGTGDPFDAASILDHNRAWLRPEFKHLKSVSFRWATGPMRLVEAFDWRADGLSLLELLDYQDWKYGVGKREMTMPDGSFHIYAPQSKYPQPKEAPAGGAEQYVREHLRGIRMNCVVLDWGIDPKRFLVREVRSNKDGTRTASLAPQKTPYRINAGVMFHSTSWAYVHDLDVALAKVTIDPASRRILREVDYSPDGERVAEIEFRDWKNAATDREVPLQIHVLISMSNKSRFDLDCRFQWCKEGLWILKSSTGSFDGKDPQRAEILDLAVNRSTPRLDRAADRFQQNAAALQEPVSASTPITLQGLYPFDLGNPISLQAMTQPNFPTAKGLLLTFDLADPSSHYSHYVELAAEVHLDRFDASKMGDYRLLLTFLDSQGLPIQGHYATLAASPLKELSAKHLVENLRKHNAALARSSPQKPLLVRGRDETLYGGRTLDAEPSPGVCPCNVFRGFVAFARRVSRTDAVRRHAGRQAGDLCWIRGQGD